MPLRRTWVHFLIPLFGISILLIALGFFAAWHVQRQQVLTSEVIAREVESMVVMQDVYSALREYRRMLDLYLRVSDPQHMQMMPRLHENALSGLAKAHLLARNDIELKQVEIVARNYERFHSELLVVLSHPETPADHKRLAELNDFVLTEQVLAPALACVEMNRDVVERTNEANRRTANDLRQGFLVLGFAGGAAGVIAGLAIARSLQQSILQLHVSVTGAAGKLEEVVGDFPLPNRGNLQDLQSGLKQMERKITEVVERLQQRELEVLRNEQLAAVGQLAAGMAHELRNPLMPMKMLVQAAVARNDGTGLRGRQLHVMEEEISRLESSIQSFLDFGRPPKPAPATGDIRRLIEQIIDLLRSRAAGQGIEFSTDLPPGPSTVVADLTQIRQVILNLALNSIDELGNGGRIEFRLRGDSPSEGAAGGWWRLAIRDTGPGFSPQVLQRIFEPFVSTKETGTGLGPQYYLHLACKTGIARAAPSVWGLRVTLDLRIGLQFALWWSMRPGPGVVLCFGLRNEEFNDGCGSAAQT